MSTATFTAELTTHAMLQGDWDAAGTTSAHLPADTAVALLTKLGWTTNGRNGWTSPNGTHRYYTDEALTFALVALAVSE